MSAGNVLHVWEVRMVKYRLSKYHADRLERVKLTSNVLHHALRAYLDASMEMDWHLVDFDLDKQAALVFQFMSCSKGYLDHMNDMLDGAKVEVLSREEAKALGYHEE